MHAEQSCLACRRLKRKCSKRMPTCSLCTRVGRSCEYPTPASTPERNSTSWRRSGPSSPQSDVLDSPIRSELRQSHGSGPSTPSHGPNPNFPVSWYIDSVFARGLSFTVPVDVNWVDVEGVEITPGIQDCKEIADQYFQTAHTWLPVVSKMRVSRLLNAATTLEAADTIALFVAMHLLSQTSSRDMEAQKAYKSLKSAIAACELNGQLTTDFLGAQVLTVVYEMSHGLYPAAYYTAGACSRSCYTMGLHDKRWATQLLQKTDTWTEVEERRRLWWANLILDRYIYIGFRFRPLATPMIPPNEIIPASDDDWDKGELAVNPLLVMSIESRTTVSAYARTCQAANLLGRVCQHVNEHADPSDTDFHFQEAHQIQRAAGALLSIIQQEYYESYTDRRHRLLSSMALCCSGLLILFDVHSCIETEEVDTGGRNKGMRIELQELAISGFKRVAISVLEMSEEIRNHVASMGPDTISPFVLNALYQAAGTYAWYTRENGNESHLASFNQLRDVLKLLAPRWEVAGVYAELLKDTELEYSGGCTQ